VGPHPTDGTVPRPAHIVVVVLENKSPARLGDAPFIGSLERSGAVFTHSYAVRHPSQPNYLALFSGSTQGVTDDSCPHSFASANLGSELRAAGLSFAGYSEGLPRAGDTTCGSGRYARKHAPWVNFTNLPASVNLRYADLPRDFAALPTVAFVVPDLCDDMHDCAVATGDAWLKAHIDGYLRWARAHDSVLILTFDEDDRTAHNKITTVFAGALVRPGTYADPIDHYSVLRTIEDAYRLPALGESAHRSPITGPWTSNGG
jgi:phosphatidylinositol-3-phosphatase